MHSGFKQTPSPHHWLCCLKVLVCVGNVLEPLNKWRQMPNRSDICDKDTMHVWVGTMLDTSVCPQNVCGSVLSYMLAVSYIRFTIMLLYLNIIVSGMHASLLSLFAVCKIWFYSHLQCPDRCKLLFRCTEPRFVHSCIEKHGNIKEKHLSWHFLRDSLKTPPMPVLAGVWPGSGDGIERALKWGIRASAWSRYVREEEEKEEPAGPGGDPAGTLILSTVAKGLVVSGIIHQCGRFR